MNLRTCTLVPLAALTASALVSLTPATASAGTSSARTAPATTMVRLPSGYCCHEIAPAGDSHVAPVLDHAGLTVPADVSVGIGCHPHNFTPEEHEDECHGGIALECASDAEAGRWGLIGLGCVPAGSSHSTDPHHVARKER
ncbi:hydrophobin family protein [Streptomyces sp. BV286]|uniref:hydrophobin family protein n=1 Tax=unclassified Streptomyces TaxID=2593676 RepID=UPI001C2EA276|nr:hydrophobin family protein [Streptomyces sp. BV286]MBV1940360.1 hydrophobin family protein [Streptomyces sp. BV286]